MFSTLSQLPLLLTAIAPMSNPTPSPGVDWQAAEQVLKVVGVLAAAVWACYQLIYLRTIVPQVEFKFDWNMQPINAPQTSVPAALVTARHQKHALKRRCSPEARYLGILTVRFKNCGKTKIDLRSNGSHVCGIRYALVRDIGMVPGFTISNSNPLPQALEDGGKIFTNHAWIEPNETIDDVLILTFDRSDVAAIFFHCHVFQSNYSKRRLSAVSAFPLSFAPTKLESSTEDEEEAYKVESRIVAGLRDSIASAKHCLFKLPSGDLRTRIQGLVGNAEQTLANLKKSPNDKRLLSAAAIIDKEWTAIMTGMSKM